MGKQSGFLKKQNTKGISTIIATLILVLFALVAGGMVWGVVSNIIEEKMSDVESCLGNFGKVEINSYYTCYNSTSNKTYIGIDVKDIEIEEISLSVSSRTQSKLFVISSETTTLPFVQLWGGGDLKMPDKNSGLTYIIDTQASGIGYPDSIQVAPKIKGKVCDVSDSLFQIDDCELIV